MSCIYYHKSLDTGKIYVGKTIHCPDKRWSDHQVKASNGSDFPLHDAIRQYGPDRFVSRIVEDNIPREDLNNRERYYINLWNTVIPNGYNKNRGGGGVIEHTKESKQKISESRIGEKNPWFGKTLPDDHKEKISESNTGPKSYWYGKTRPLETRRKMSISKMGENNPMKNPEVSSRSGRSKSGDKHYTKNDPVKKQRWEESFRSDESINKANKKRKLTRQRKKIRELEEMGQTNFLDWD